MTLSSARSVSCKVRTRTVSSLATWRNGVVSVRNVTSTWYWATNSPPSRRKLKAWLASDSPRSEEHTSELQSQSNLVCRLLLEKKKKLQTSSLASHLLASPRPNAAHDPCTPLFPRSLPRTVHADPADPYTLQAATRSYATDPA